MATLGTANVYSCTNLVSGYASTVTAAGTTTLSATSAYQQYFTGTTTQTVRLPVVTTLVNGQSYQIVNLSTGTVSVQTGGGTAITTVTGSTNATFTCVNNASDVPGSWFFGTRSSGSITLNGDVTGATSSNTLVKINTQPITGRVNDVLWGYSGSAPTTTQTVGIGYQALNVCTATSHGTFGSGFAAGANTALGYQALLSCTTGGANSAFGFQALQSMLTGTGHTAAGYQAANLLTSTNTSSALGYQALAGATTTGFNYVAGHQALSGSNIGSNNCVFGYQSCLQNNFGSNTAAFGESSITNIGNMNDNAAFGRRALGGSFQNAGTVQTTGSTITGSGTAFTPALIGGSVIVAGVSTPAVINSWASSTSLTQTGSFSSGPGAAYRAYPLQSNNVSFGAVASTNSGSNNSTIFGTTSGYGPSTYSVGTAGTGGASSTTVTGVGTRWNTSWDLTNASIRFTTGNSSFAIISSINSGTSLTLASAITETAGQSYIIYLPNVPIAIFVGSTLKTGSYSTGTASQSASVITGTSTAWETQPETWINYSSGGANMPVRTVSINSPTSITAQRPLTITSTAYTLTYGSQYYSVNTASQSGTTVTGTGTSFTPYMVDATLTFLGSFYSNFNSGACSQSGTTITGISTTFTASMAPGYIVFFTSYSFSVGTITQTGNIITSTVSDFNPGDEGNYILWGVTAPATAVSYIVEVLSATTVRVAESRTLGSSSYVFCRPKTGSSLVTAFVNATTLTAATVSSQTIPNSGYILFYNNGAPRKITAFNSPTSLTVDTSQTIGSCTYIIQDGNGKLTGCNNTMIGGYSTSFSVPNNDINSGDGGYVILSDNVGTPKLTITPNVSHALNLPSTINSSTYTHLFTDSSLVFTTTNCTITLLSPSAFLGAMLYVTNITANSLTSASANVVPMASTTAGTAILAATAGRYAVLQSDGTNWNIIMSN